MCAGLPSHVEATLAISKPPESPQALKSATWRLDVVRLCSVDIVQLTTVIRDPQYRLAGRIGGPPGERLFDLYSLMALTWRLKAFESAPEI